MYETGDFERSPPRSGGFLSPRQRRWRRREERGSSRPGRAELRHAVGGDGRDVAAIVLARRCQ
ncbi:MAG: hypothetical protein AVDCRST_MAG49-551 [uncultured Thermomicrobiales bacterium]|uniref:Uncharacterized protein n=1 Tax=uncultured Thermomicrobiales bacterium TaxID=1645740 RepID=A0A6J4U462_9BACT|nr:MAG: hypothetical protein AVDCRST_MAG49-551 [uncultured Thermomicrobiales bacterium]